MTQAGLPEDTLLLIDLIAKAISSCMILQLAQASNMMHQTAAAGIHVHQAQLERTPVLHPQPVHTLGIRPTIIVDISNFIGSGNAAPGLRAVNTALVPTRLIQLTEIPVTRQASKEFTNELHKVVKATLLDDVKSEGDQVTQALARELNLHKQRHHMEDSESCCIFKLLEEDYQYPNHAGRKEVANFGLKCGVCNGRHEIKVFR
ncbi:hypothetical protein N0V90_006821 [Kalmusia sp. IMI 367209]|nr:hypothetical protein N0V90_006821 [Kalmusia sp. IMI 367209]